MRRRRGITHLAHHLRRELSRFVGHSFRIPSPALIPPGVRIPTRGDEQREMAQHNDERERDAHGDDDTLVDEGAVGSEVLYNDVIRGRERGEDARHNEREPEDEIAADVGARVYTPSQARGGEPDADVGHVPDDGEAEGDVFPGEQVGVCFLLDGFDADFAVVEVVPFIVISWTVIAVKEVRLGRRDESDGDDG